MSSKDEREFLEKLRSTSIKAAADVMEGLQRLRDFHDEMMDDGSGTAPRPRVADHFYQLAKLELEHAASVLRLGSVQADMLFDHVRQLARGVRGGEPPMRVLELEHEDGAYKGQFEVRNPFEHRADVRFQISELRDANGEPAEDLLPTARSRTSPIPPHGASYIDVELAVAKLPAKIDVLFGHVEVFLSADVERRVARRSLKVRRHG